MYLSGNRVGTLLLSRTAGEGFIVLDEEFAREEHPTLQADVIRDWIAALEELLEDLPSP